MFSDSFAITERQDAGDGGMAPVTTIPVPVSLPVADAYVCRPSRVNANATAANTVDALSSPAPRTALAIVLVSGRPASNLGWLEASSDLGILLEQRWDRGGDSDGEGRRGSRYEFEAVLYEALGLGPIVPFGSAR